MSALLTKIDEKNIATVTLNRPLIHNAIDDQLIHELMGVFRDLEQKPQVRAVDELDVQLWRGDTLIGVLARRRELLPGRYTFGLTGRGPEGERLRRGRYLIRVVARPGDGTRRQVESIEYVVR